MRFLLRLLTRELLRTVRRPWRVLGILSKEKVRAYAADLDRRRLILRYGESWKVHESNPAFLRRAYASYQDYVAHQRSKLARVDLARYDLEYRRVLRERLEAVSGLREGMTVLCLAARLGTEVKAFLDKGCFAVGIDLNPGPHNRYVVHGDFHEIQFPPGSVDVIFSNSLDHAFDLDRLSGEIKRVLKPRGS